MPSSDPEQAGVLIHTFDGHLDAERPWELTTGGWHDGYAHVLSASLVNSRKSGIFSQKGGIVLSPSSRIFCSYPYDGGAMEYATGCGPRWCSEPDDIWGCAFPPNMLNRMMELYDDKRVGSGWSYNEIVIDPAHMAIEAVIYGSQLQPGDVSAADVHSR